jgi:two-component system invasion response regulator UvrY
MEAQCIAEHDGMDRSHGRAVMIRILIADDHSIMRKGLKQLFSETNDMMVTGEVSDGAQVLEMISKGSYDLALLDISMPVKNGFEVLKELRCSHQHIPVIILSMHPQGQYASMALKAGALAYITKERASEDLVSAVREICLK